MSKHTLHTHGLTFEWDDTDTNYSRERTLLELYDKISSLHSWTTYIGEDPEKEWNNHVSELQESVINWIIELRKE